MPVLFRMSTDIITSLLLDKNIATNRVIAVKEINGCDSLFITSCILGHCIKNKQAVLIIATHNSLLHYQSVGLKMNYNLQKQIDIGLVHFFKLDEDLVNILMANQHTSLDNVFNNLREIVASLKRNYSEINIIFDGVSQMFNMQYSLTEINKFCKDVVRLAENDLNSFVLFHCNIACEDNITRDMANLLCHLAHTVVEVGSLGSGWSADVSGHLTIKHPGHKFKDDHMYMIDTKPSRYLFKLFDRGVKLFAPGTV